MSGPLENVPEAARTTPPSAKGGCPRCPEPQPNRKTHGPVVSAAPAKRAPQSGENPAFVGRYPKCYPRTAEAWSAMGDER